MNKPMPHDEKAPLVDDEAKQLIWFHVRAICIAAAFIGTLVAFIGVTVLDDMTDGAAEFTGLGVAAVGIVLGYAVSGYYLIKENDRD